MPPAPRRPRTVTLLDRIRECNDWDPSRFRPFMVCDQAVGLVRDDVLADLGRHDGVLQVGEDVVRLDPALPDEDARTAALEPVVADLSARGRLLPLVSESYPVSSRYGDAPLLRLERAALPVFGVRAHGVHLNGWVRRDDGGVDMWVARRARDKPTYPGMLDNMVAGGQPHGLGVRENLAKECAEEAAIPAELAAEAVATGAVWYRHEHARGLKDDVLFLFELELPRDFEPRPVDGEVESFELWPLDEVLHTAATTHDFKFNCPLAIIDFALRRGHIGPEHPEFLELVAGLRPSAL